MTTQLERASGLGWQFSFRAPEANPLDPRCKPALRRTCGTCAHFAGKIGGGAARCGWFQIDKTAGARADRCRRWERKGAGHV